jgi:hypothetical protein
MRFAARVGIIRSQIEQWRHARAWTSGGMADATADRLCRPGIEAQG